MKGSVLLEVRCGTADKSHENRFFRYFAFQVKDYFERVGIDGILVGMPGCTVLGNLQMDALLITDSSLTIIDFKEYADCEVFLPDESDFERGRWNTNEDFYVKGGSSPNPYAQLMLQRSRLKEILDRFCRHKLGDFESSHISAMVCFTGSVSIVGSIPGWAKLKFFIADSESFLERLYDIANVRAVGLLESDFVTSKFDMLFEAQPYECEVKPSRPFVQEEAEASLPVTVDENTDIIRRFFAGNSDVLIISSIDPLERQRLAIVAQEEAHDAGFDEASILSSTKLVGDNLCTGLQLDGSLYSEVYDFNSRYKDPDGIDHICLGKPPCGYSLRYEEDLSGSNDADIDIRGESRFERITFVVCESHLVSSNAWLDGSVVFGSGRLLTDVLEYLSIDEGNNGKNKIVFIGDDCQLGASSQNSSLRAEAYPRGVVVEEMTLPVRESDSQGCDFTLNLALGIRHSDYSLLSVDGSAENPRIARLDEERLLIEDAAENWRTHKIIAYKNEQAKQLNLFIKRSVLHSGELLSPNDVLLLNEQLEAVVCNPLNDGFSTRTIRNGEFVRLTHVGSATVEIPVDEHQGEPAGSLTIVPVRFVPEGSNEECEAWLVLEYLYAQKAELTAAQEQAIQIKLGDLEREARSKNPFKSGNRWFDSMISEGNFVEITRQAGEVVYRQPDDKRTMTPQEREYQDEIRRTLKSPGSQYFLLSNLMKARYGWAITAHKAQSNRWDTVTLSANADMGRNSDGYFRFLYTGASRSTDQLNVVRWADISPFCDTVFDAHPSNVRKKAKKSVLFKATSDSPVAQQISSYLGRANLANITIEHQASSSWREAFSLKRENAEATIAFDYNKTLEVFAPRLEKGDASLLAMVSQALTEQEEIADADSRMVDAYRYAQRLSNGNTSIAIQKSTPYRDEIRVENEIGTFYAAVHYGANKIASRVELQSGSADAFDAFRLLLTSTD